MQDIYDDLTSDPPLDELNFDSQLDDLTSGSLLEDSFAVPKSSLYQSMGIYQAGHKSRLI